MLCLRVINCQHNMSHEAPQMHMKDLSNGVVFHETGELVLSNTFVIVPVKFSFEDLLNSMHKIREGIQITMANIRPFKNNDTLIGSLTHDLDILDSTVTSKIAKIYDFFYGLQSSSTSFRSKRGALDVVGDIASTLFGVATENQLNGLNKILSNINELSVENANRLNILNKVIDLSVNRIDKMRNSQIRVHLALERLVNQTNLFVKMQSNLEHKELIAHSFTKLSLTFLETSEISDQIISGVSVMFSGKLDNRVISNKYLNYLLSEVTKNNHKLLLGNKNKLLNTYKELTSVTASFDIDLKNIHFFLSLPITNPTPSTPDPL